MPVISFLGDNHRLPLFHMAKRFIWLEGGKDALMSFQLDI